MGTWVLTQPPFQSSKMVSCPQQDVEHTVQDAQDTNSYTVIHVTFYTIWNTKMVRCMGVYTTAIPKFQNCRLLTTAC
jgi:hypothetical protein